MIWRSIKIQACTAMQVNADENRKQEIIKLIVIEASNILRKCRRECKSRISKLNWVHSKFIISYD